MTNTLENICTDLATSKRLKELGIEDETCFYIKIDIQPDMSGKVRHSFGYLSPLNYKNPERFYKVNRAIKAYTIQQIWDLLPADIIAHQLPWTLDISFYFEHIGYVDEEHIIAHSNNNGFSDYLIKKLPTENLATTAARLLIKLKEEELV